MRLITVITIVMLLLVVGGVTLLGITDCACVSYDGLVYCRCDYWLIIVVDVILWSLLAFAAACGYVADEQSPALDV